MNKLLATCLILFSIGSTQALPNGVRDDLENDNPPSCPPLGDFYAPHPDCTKYYQCVNSILIEGICPGNLYWNQNIERCDFPYEVPECFGGTRDPVVGTTTAKPNTTTTTPPLPTSLPPSTQDPTTTTTTIKSTTEEIIITTEAPTTEGEVSTTQPPQKSTTEEEDEETFPTDLPTTRDPNNPCNPTGVYTLPVPNNCSAYIQCANGAAISLTCAPGLLYDHSIGKCNKEELVECAIYSTTVEITTTTEEPIPTTTPPPVCRPEGIYNVPVKGSCSLYILCANGLPVLQECAPELSFDPIELQCVRKEDSTCVLPTVPTQPPTTQAPTTTTTEEPIITTTKAPIRCENDGVYNIPYPGSNCTQYFLCINYIPIIQSCAAGTLFSNDLLKCVRAEDYSCPETVAPSTVAPSTEEPIEETTADDGTIGPITEEEGEETTEGLIRTTEGVSTTLEPIVCPPSIIIYLPHQRKCSLFHVCRFGEYMGVFVCASSDTGPNWFDSVKQACILPKDSDCTLEPRP